MFQQLSNTRGARVAVVRVTHVEELCWSTRYWSITQTLKSSSHRLGNWASSGSNRNYFSPCKRLRDLSWNSWVFFYDTSFPRNLQPYTWYDSFSIPTQKEKLSKSITILLKSTFKAKTLRKWNWLPFQKSPFYSGRSITVLYQRSKTVGSTIFNYKDVVNEPIFCLRWTGFIGYM